MRPVIASLHGRVTALETDAAVVDVAGVGYRVFVPAPLLADLGPVGSTVTLHTYLHVRENELALYGASDPATVRLFQMLLGVSGIGPRIALAVLSTYSSEDIQTAIVAEDVEALTRVSGIGKKMRNG